MQDFKMVYLLQNWANFLQLILNRVTGQLTINYGSLVSFSLSFFVKFILNIY